MSSIVLTGVSDFLKYVDGRTAKAVAAVDAGVVQIAGEIQREAVLSINKQSQGQEVTRNGRKHTVSLKGQAPNTDTGRLVGSIAIQHKKNSKEAMVFSDLDYAAYLEFVLDRPWLKPAVEMKRPLLQTAIADAMARAFK